MADDGRLVKAAAPEHLGEHPASPRISGEASQSWLVFWGPLASPAS